MFGHLHISSRSERIIVGTADAVLGPLAKIALGSSKPIDASTPKRILLLRLERVGDLLMVLDAIAMIREGAPTAQIDLIVGSWNRALAELIPGVDRVETLDAPWMARAGTGDSWPALLRRAWLWRQRQYDLAINFEADIRSNLLLACSGSLRRIGFVSGGGGALLTDPLDDDRAAYVGQNARTLAARAIGASAAGARSSASTITLRIPAEAQRRASEILGPVADSTLIGIQPGAGRQIREWDPAKFGEVASALARDRRVSFVLTGSVDDDRALAATKAAWPAGIPLIELPPTTDLVVLAAVLERLSLFITGDTGPMHLASALGTPTVAVFGPSLPSRYAPPFPRTTIVRIDLPCSPCNRLRQPPSRCVGHVPDCLAGIEASQVAQAAVDLLEGAARRWPLRALESTGRPSVD